MQNLTTTGTTTPTAPAARRPARRRSKQASPALQASIAALAAGTATLDAPAPVVAPNTAGTEPSAAERGLATADPTQALGLQPGAIAAVQAAIGKNLRDSQVSKQERKVVKDASLDIAMGVGLGESAETNDEQVGYGPMTRTLIIKMMKTTITKGKAVKITDLSRINIQKVLGLPNFAAVAAATLDAYLLELEALAVSRGKTPAQTTLDARKANAELTRTWIKNGLNTVYSQALDNLTQFGGQIPFGNGVTMPLDRALGVAFGRNITASELYRSNNVKPTKAAA